MTGAAQIRGRRVDTLGRDAFSSRPLIVYFRGLHQSADSIRTGIRIE